MLGVKIDNKNDKYYYEARENFLGRKDAFSHAVWKASSEAGVDNVLGVYVAVALSKLYQYAILTAILVSFLCFVLFLIFSDAKIQDAVVYGLISGFIAWPIGLGLMRDLLEKRIVTN